MAQTDFHRAWCRPGRRPLCSVAQNGARQNENPYVRNLVRLSDGPHSMRNRLIGGHKQKKLKLGTQPVHRRNTPTRINLFTYTRAPVAYETSDLRSDRNQL